MTDPRRRPTGRLGRYASALLAGSLLLAGCGSSSPANPPDASTSIVRPTATTTAAPPAPTADFTGHFPYTDQQGYTYDVSYSLTLGSPVRDDADAPPGQSMVRFPDIAGSLSVSNTTSGGRTAPGIQINAIRFYAFFKGSRPICQADPNEILPVTLTQPSGTYCVVMVYEEVPPDSSAGGIGPGQSLAYSGGEYDNLTAAGTPAPSGVVLNAVPSSHMASVLADWQRGPDIWVLGLRDDQSQCKIGTVALAESGYYLTPLAAKPEIRC